MFRILVTDASYKHSLAIQRYVRAAFGDAVWLIGHDERRSVMPRLYGHLDAYVAGQPLAGVLLAREFDMVIAVGGQSVAAASTICPDASVLPSVGSLQMSHDKAATVALAARLGVRAPRTSVVDTVADHVRDDIGFPCVVKAACETEAKGVAYAHNRTEREAAIRRMLPRLPSTGSHGVLVQEYVEGVGHGLFALYDRGRAVRVFMHQRLREFPVTGGASTAARSYYDGALRTAGLRLLDALDWHGVAMVEFKRDSATGEFVLMEINGKFWGSSELAHAAGVNFGADVVRVFRGDSLTYSEAYDRDCHFYWPFDDDVLALWQTRQLRRVREYVGPGARTNLGQSWPADLVRAARTAARIATRGRRAH